MCGLVFHVLTARGTLRRRCLWVHGEGGARVLGCGLSVQFLAGFEMLNNEGANGLQEELKAVLALGPPLRGTLG